MSSRVAWIVAVVLACGPKQATESSEPPDERERKQATGGRTQATREIEPGLGCPRRFDPALLDGACEPGSAACSFAEAECRCVPRFPCSGVDPGYVEVSTLPHVWSCDVTDPTVLRQDGCPAMVPSPGDACKGEQVCHYAPYCGGLQSTARCVDKAWQLDQREIAPPPSTEG